VCLRLVSGRFGFRAKHLRRPANFRHHRFIRRHGPRVSAAQQFELVARNALGTTYSAVKVRDALEELYKTKRIVSAKVEASPVGENGVNLRFVIRRKTKAEKVVINIGETRGDDEITEQELLLKLNLLNPGTSITDQTLSSNADAILVYLRERGFFKAEVSFSQQPTKAKPK
jgi:outer membrane protein assembly factor BamA